MTELYRHFDAANALLYVGVSRFKGGHRAAVRALIQRRYGKRGGGE